VQLSSYAGDDSVRNMCGAIPESGDWAAKRLAADGLFITDGLLTRLSSLVRPHRLGRYAFRRPQEAGRRPLR